MKDEQMERISSEKVSRIQAHQSALSEFHVREDMTIQDRRGMLEQARKLIDELQPLVQLIKHRDPELMSDDDQIPIANLTLQEMPP